MPGRVYIFLIYKSVWENTTKSMTYIKKKSLNREQFGHTYELGLVILGLDIEYAETKRTKLRKTNVKV